jgi:hypothetical protein
VGRAGERKLDERLSDCVVRKELMREVLSEAYQHLADAFGRLFVILCSQPATVHTFVITLSYKRHTHHRNPTRS